MISLIRIQDVEVNLQDLKRLYLPGNYIARQRRQNYENSQAVFPLCQKGDNDYKTHYSLQFCNKLKGRPSSPRPCSPTRRNNPHPSKDFLNWRIPTRVYDFGDKKEANIKFLKMNIADTHQSFYSDYNGRTEKGNDINSTMVLEIGKASDRAIQNTTQIKKSTQDCYLNCNIGKINLKKHLYLKVPNLGKSWSPDLSFRENQERKHPEKKTTSKSKQHDLQNYLQACQEKEEEELVKMTIKNTLKPDTVEAIQKWLGNADAKDKEFALELIKTIILESRNNTDSKYTTKKSMLSNMYMHNIHSSCHNHIQARWCVSPNIKQHFKKDRLHKEKFSRQCNNCPRQQLELMLQQLEIDLQEENSAISELMNPCTLPTNQTSAIQEFFHSEKNQQFDKSIKRPKKKTYGFIPNKGSIFINAKQKRTKHYTIHPEWQ
ncbi:uncharacterized protein LOC105845736 isoform X1 [Hydra vulgaris]|uniref:Uncharacterized protein LOC105845736 isoform X1 n=2 Tax=Hydra vulgaris TaxID=6087 RepID=A0ABM4BDJ6_HYDVU